jgi:predicted RNA-binding protein with TRAM domain
MSLGVCVEINTLTMDTYSFILGTEDMSYGRRNSYGGGYGGRGQSNFGGPKPVEIGKEYDVHITETSQRGDGVARIEGFVVFVRNGKVGQSVKVKVNSVGNRFAIADIV